MILSWLSSCLSPSFTPSQLPLVWILIACFLLCISILDHFIWFHTDESYISTAIPVSFLSFSPAFSTTYLTSLFGYCTDSSSQTCSKLNSSSNLFTNLIPGSGNCTIWFPKIVKPNSSTTISNTLDSMSSESLGSILCSTSSLTYFLLTTGLTTSELIFGQTLSTLRLFYIS